MRELRMNAFFTFCTHDWYFAVPMALMSIIGLSLVIWRLLLNYNGSVSMSEFLPVFSNGSKKKASKGRCSIARAAPRSSRIAFTSPGWNAQTGAGRRPPRDGQRD